MSERKLYEQSTEAWADYLAMKHCPSEARRERKLAALDDKVRQTIREVYKHD